MWSVQRSFAHAPGATLGRQKGPEVNVTIEYLLFTPEVAAGAAGPRGLSRRLPLLCFLHGIGDHVGNWLRHQPLSMGVFTEPSHQKRLPLFVLRPQVWC